MSGGGGREDSFAEILGVDEFKKEMEVNFAKGFLGMMGSIDCFRDYMFCVCL